MRGGILVFRAENRRLQRMVRRARLEFVEREATSRLLMNLSIPLHLVWASLSNTIFFLEIFGVNRARSTVYN